ncbi:MAG: DNA-processing protein DprA [Bacteroidota bacterium]
MSIQLKDLLILSSVPGVGPGRLRSLVSHFKTPAAVAQASVKELVLVEGIEKKTAHTIANFYRDSCPSQYKRYVDDQLSRLNKIDGRTVTFWDKHYPENLKKIYDPPPVLFLRGSFQEEDKYSIAIVGTRTPTPYGTHLAEKFAAELARYGIPIISGLARGIDTVAHAATVKSGGRTIAVIGSGIDVIYPPENKTLVDRILPEGAIVSEYVMGTKPDAGNFPRRNRIISGIALGTLIVETGVDGGAMITAATALDQNRDVFAIPAAISEKRSSGTNLLLKQGKATLVESVDDILSELGPRLKKLIAPSTTKAEPLPPLSLFEQRLYEALPDDPIHIDALAERSAMSTGDALVHLLSLEFKGIVRQMPGKMFAKLA